LQLLPPPESTRPVIEKLLKQSPRYRIDPALLAFFKGWARGNITGLIDMKISSNEETLLSDLKSGDIKKRRDSIRMIGGFKGPKVVAALLDSLSDEDPFVRRQAVVS